jgi:hypothetical protein
VLRSKSGGGKGAQDHDPEEVRVALNRLKAWVKNKTVPLGEIARVAKGNERVIGQKPVNGRMEGEDCE